MPPGRENAFIAVLLWSGRTCLYAPSIPAHAWLLLKFYLLTLPYPIETCSIKPAPRPMAAPPPPMTSLLPAAALPPPVLHASPSPPLRPARYTKVCQARTSHLISHFPRIGCISLKSSSQSQPHITSLPPFLSAPRSTFSPQPAWATTWCCGSCVSRRFWNGHGSMEA